MHPFAARLIVTFGFSILMLGSLGAKADPDGLPPVIDFTDPPTGVVAMVEETNLLFTVTASDPEGSNLVYQWRLGQQTVGADAPMYLAETTWGDAGIYTLHVDIFDGDWTNSATWWVHVSPDNDGDGVGNAYENAHDFLNPWDRTDATNDLDGDGLINVREFQRHTSMTNADTDADGLPDGWEVRYGRDPNSSTGAIADAYFEWEGEWQFPFKGYALHVVCTGDTAFVALGGGGLRVYDIGDPTNAVPVGGITANGNNDNGIKSGLALAGDLLYVADTAGLRIVDVSDAQQPSVVADVPTGWATDVVVDGEWAYVATVYDGLHIYNVSNAAAPELTGSLHAPGVQILGLALRGDDLFVAAGSAGLAIVDVADPAVPALLGRVDTDFAMAVTVAGDYAFVADDQSQVLTVNIGEVTNPVTEASLYIYGAQALGLEGTTLYVGGQSFSVVDAADPLNLMLQGQLGDMGWINGMDIGGVRACLAATEDLVLVDVSDPLVPQTVGLAAVVSQGYAVDVLGPLAGLAGGDEGLFLLDVSDPSDPLTLGQLDAPGGVRDVEMDDGFAIISDGEWGNWIATVDIADPTQPTQLASLTFADLVGGFDVAGDLACVFTYVQQFEERESYQLHLVDVQDPGNLVTNGTLGVTPDVYDVAMHGAYVYAAVDGGMLVVDASAPQAPLLAGLVNLGVPVKAVAVSNQYAYVVDGDVRVSVIDISDPADPNVVATSSVLFTEPVVDIAVDGDFAYVSTIYGVWALNVRDPLNPSWVEANWYSGVNYNARLATAGGILFQATDAGLQAFRLAPVDSDRDGLPDYWEQDWFEGLHRDGRSDLDGDGLLDFSEYAAGLDPTRADQDGDGLVDGAEVNQYGSNPEARDTDGDGIGDGEEVVAGADGVVTSLTKLDTDGDGVVDSHELALGRNPTVPEPAYVTVFSDDVENDGSHWQATGAWEIGHDDYASAFSSWTESPWRPYARGGMSTLSLQTPIDLSAYKHGWLRFQHTLMLDGEAVAVVGISTDGGQSWEELHRYDGYQRVGWSDQVLAISEYCGYDDVRIGFTFLATGSGVASSTGWHLDDLEVFATTSEVGGMVTGAGSALPGARVMLRPRFATGDVFTMWDTTDASGTFAFELPVPGAYLLKADHASYGAEFHADVTSPLAATPVVLDMDEQLSIDFDLRPGQSPGQIQVTSAPGGAAVYLDFASVGVQTPVLLNDIEPGSHFVSVALPGYPRVAPRGVAVREADVTSVAFGLSVPAGALRVESAPQSGAAVYLDFQPTGLSTPCVITNLAADLPAASHFVSVAKAGLVSPVPVSVWVDAFETNLVTFVLPVEGVGDLQLSSSPTGAVIWLDFQNVARSTDALLEDLAVGSHTVRVALPGFGKPAARGVQIASGEVSRVHFNLGVVDPTDADGDGLPDAWERASGLSAAPGSGGTGQHGADGDWDGDGMSNADELEAGTSPTDPGSVLDVFEAVRGTNAGPFRITWQTVPGKRYRVDVKDSLLEGTWTPLTGFVGADGDSQTFFDEAFPELTNRVYRIVVLPFP